MLGSNGSSQRPRLDPPDLRAIRMPNLCEASLAFAMVENAALSRVGESRGIPNAGNSVPVGRHL